MHSPDCGPIFARSNPTDFRTDLRTPRRRRIFRGAASRRNAHRAQSSRDDRARNRPYAKTGIRGRRSDYRRGSIAIRSMLWPAKSTRRPVQTAQRQPNACRDRVSCLRPDEIPTRACRSRSLRRSPVRRRQRVRAVDRLHLLSSDAAAQNDGVILTGAKEIRKRCRVADQEDDVSTIVSVDASSAGSAVSTPSRFAIIASC